jgi:hypothetical protein
MWRPWPIWWYYSGVPTSDWGKLLKIAGSPPEIRVSSTSREFGSDFLRQGALSIARGLKGGFPEDPSDFIQTPLSVCILRLTAVPVCRHRPVRRGCVMSTKHSMLRWNSCSQLSVQLVTFIIPECWPVAHCLMYNYRLTAVTPRQKSVWLMYQVAYNQYLYISMYTVTVHEKHELVPCKIHVSSL